MEQIITLWPGSLRQLPREICFTTDVQSAGKYVVTHTAVPAPLPPAPRQGTMYWLLTDLSWPTETSVPLAANA